MQAPFALSRGYTKNAHVENFGPKIMQGEINHEKMSKIFCIFSVTILMEVLSMVKSTEVEH